MKKNEKNAARKSPPATWKNIERKIARFFGSDRTPLSGSNSKHSQSDSLHPILYIETKYRVAHSAITLWRDTAEKAKAEEKIPVVALAEKNKQGFWVLVHSSDLTAVAHQRSKLKKAGY